MAKLCVWRARAGQLKKGVGLGGLIVTLVFSLSSPGRTSAAERGTLVPGGWTPSLEGVQTVLEDAAEAKEPKSQQFLNRTSESLADLRDAQLFITYVLLAQTLNAKERSDLFDEQKRWLSKRETAAEAAVLSKGGSLEPLEYSGAFRKITEERLAELEKRLAQRRSTYKSNPLKREP